MDKSYFIGEHRRAANLRLTFLRNILGGGIVLAIFIALSNIDFREANEAEQRAASIACRVVGAEKAVRIATESGSVFVCNLPVAGYVAGAV